MISEPNQNRSAFPFLLLLFALAAAVFHPVGGYSFLNWDDNIYLQDNPHLRSGFTAESVNWAFTANLTHFSPHAEYWAPLTLLTRIADAHFFGISPGAMHVVSVFIHAMNAALLAFSLHALSGKWGRSAVVALLFLVHPQNLEPSMWLSARKDLVAATFFFLTLWAYAAYVKSRTRRRYGVLLLAFIGALMAKPMAVTVPVILLLLDFWPLNRWGNRAENIRIFAEKIPLGILAGVAAILAVMAQQDVGAMGSHPISARISNAIYAVAMYLKRAFWPSDLCVFYPHTNGALSAGFIAVCASVTVVITTIAIWLARKKPVVLAGWSWFLIGLLPVIGLVQVGLQSMADRYFYTPGIGLFILAVWLLGDALPSIKLKSIIAGCSIVALAVTSAFQVRFWKDSETAFVRAIEVTHGNYIAHGNLGSHYFVQGRTDLARRQFMESLRLNPYQFSAWNNLGAVELSLKNSSAALDAYARAVALNPRHAIAQFRFGKLLAEMGRNNEAVEALRRAVELAPNWPEPAKLLGEIQ
jgi:protein O-mannosyl-transferase